MPSQGRGGGQCGQSMVLGGRVEGSKRGAGPKPPGRVKPWKDFSTKSILCRRRRSRIYSLDSWTPAGPRRNWKRVGLFGRFRLQTTETWSEWGGGVMSTFARSWWWQDSASWLPDKEEAELLWHTARNEKRLPHRATWGVGGWGWGGGGHWAKVTASQKKQGEVRRFQASCERSIMNDSKSPREKGWSLDVWLGGVVVTQGRGSNKGRGWDVILAKCLQRGIERF